jgi:hypothetical protein
VFGLPGSGSATLLKTTPRRKLIKCYMRRVWGNARLRSERALRDAGRGLALASRAGEFRGVWQAARPCLRTAPGWSGPLDQSGARPILHLASLWVSEAAL